MLSMKWIGTPYIVCLLMACSSASKSGNPGAFTGFGSGASGFGAAASGATAPVNPSGEGSACQTDGATRSCCKNAGTQKCSGAVEFMFWGPCLDAKGAVVTTCIPPTPGQPSGCGIGEFAKKCDAGVDSGIPHKCGEGEFAPSCEQPPLCKDKKVNTEPEILAAYSPASGQSVGAAGQIKVWVNDERPTLIALNEQVDATTGKITAPGDRTGKAPDGYLWEPALYIAPQTAETGGTPHFPQWIKGWYNNMPPYVRGAATSGVEVPGMESPPAGTQLPETYTTELIWDVSALGLKPGSYSAEFVIHDGDRDRAIGCVTITIK